MIPDLIKKPVQPSVLKMKHVLVYTSSGRCSDCFDGCIAPREVKVSRATDDRKSSHRMVEVLRTLNQESSVVVVRLNVEIKSAIQSQASETKRRGQAALHPDKLRC